MLARHFEMLGLRKAQARAPYNQHLLCSDGDDSVSLAVRGRSLSKDMEAVASLRTDCSSHIASGWREDVAGLTPEVSSKLIHLSLSMKGGSNLRTFRTAFRIAFMRMAVPLRNQQPSPMRRSLNLRGLDFWLPESVRTKVAQRLKNLCVNESRGLRVGQHWFSKLWYLKFKHHMRWASQVFCLILV